ncbi:3-hydroxyacyl-CoA dehydrogenase family protein [Halalkalicoccus sp. NIPERK01]|uniref:3-hydroxyacyl-CoA dehydrogenase family protein n=1 Tax=Halalkalicoccus sp. NIPERK01 TaxID=3053469 RepID=UPI00256EDFA7|nr:3-hydroxyacyl-CoA dehydrogenase family protein [Halalkalicoccus sp. NIPERK01]MDL5360479.1 3-hydroxyacyl-CoA dehydrogenase family protein [Halalkalicoccus sp. NIPERK01]
MRVTVLGAGTMGHGIAQVTAMAGNDVTIRDIDDAILKDGVGAIESNLQGGVDRGKVSEEEKAATLDRIGTTTDLEAAVAEADLVVEAVPEDLGIKHDTFEAVEAAAPNGAVLASNTSSLSVTEIASVLDDPSRAIGLHFFNPVHIMGLVEIVVAEQTDEETVAFAERFVDDIEKEPVTVRDSAGFASSRLGVALGVEAIRMLETGVAGPRAIDRAMELGYNHPMGPIELTDVVGLDVRLDILEYLQEELGERFRPPQLLRQKVRAGKLGKKTGEGFYVWDEGEVVGVSGDLEGGR